MVRGKGKGVEKVFWYTGAMHIWDYDPATLTQDATAEQWQLERMINYGLNGRKIPRALLEQHLPELRIPPDRRAFLQFLLA